MAATDPLDDYLLSYQEFYSELPGSTDYLNDIDPAIHDEHELENDTLRGLTAQQVSEIARDSLSASSNTTSIADENSAQSTLLPPNNTLE